MKTAALIIIAALLLTGCKEPTILEQCKDALITTNATILKQNLKIKKLQFDISLHHIKKAQLKSCLEDRTEYKEENQKLKYSNIILKAQNDLLTDLIDYFDPACFVF